FQGGLKLMIKWFDCGQHFMTKEMQKTLKADKRPEMKINLISIARVHKNGQTVKGIVDVEIAGITKRIDINFDVKKPRSTSLCFVGTKHLKFSDFNLEPPVKLAGLVKVEQDILVKFQINLRSAQ
ncbi:MAG: YceI family protein, partial [Flavitalea sp.]